MEKIKITIDYYRGLLDKFINILILTVGGTASTFLSYSSKPSEAKLFLTISGVFLSVAFLIVIIKIHSFIRSLISKL